MTSEQFWVLFSIKIVFLSKMKKKKKKKKLGNFFFFLGIFFFLGSEDVIFQSFFIFFFFGPKNDLSESPFQMPLKWAKSWENPKWPPKTIKNSILNTPNKIKKKKKKLIFFFFWDPKMTCDRFSKSSSVVFFHVQNHRNVHFFYQFLFNFYPVKISWHTNDWCLSS